jgi:hypothetical protein
MQQRIVLRLQEGEAGILKVFFDNSVFPDAQRVGGTVSFNFIFLKHVRFLPLWYDHWQPYGGLLRSSPCGRQRGLFLAGEKKRMIL